MAAAAALQQTPTIFGSNKPIISSQLVSKPSLKFQLTSIFTPKLSLKTTRNKSRGGPTMAESAAGSYANALSDVAKSNNTLDLTFSDMEKIDKFFDDTVIGYFTNPTISEDSKIEVVEEITKSGNLQPHVANFLNILVDMKRIGMIKEIIKEFELVYNRSTDTEVAVVTSVVPLEAQHMSQIAKGVQKLTGAKNVRIKSVIDPSLVAGFTIRYGESGSKFIDMSVKKQLEEIAERLDLGDIQLAK